MATSGTTTFDLDLMELLDEAYEQAGRVFRSGHDYESARRSLNLVFQEWANKGVNLWTLDQGSISLVAGQATYSLPANTVDLLDIFLTVDDRDYQLTRIGHSSYASINDKTKQARPQQVFVERHKAPHLTLWPIPEKAYTLKYWRLRRIQDAGQAQNTLDLPTRFLPALAAALAVQLARKNPQIDVQRLTILSEIAERAMREAQGEDRDRSSFYLRVSRRRI